MISPSARHRPKSTKSAYPPEVFDQVPDLLADLVLEDVLVQKGRKGWEGCPSIGEWFL